MKIQVLQRHNNTYINRHMNLSNTYIHTHTYSWRWTHIHIKFKHIWNDMLKDTSIFTQIIVHMHKYRFSHKIYICLDTHTHIFIKLFICYFIQSFPCFSGYFTHLSNSFYQEIKLFHTFLPGNNIHIQSSPYWKRHFTHFWNFYLEKAFLSRISNIPMDINTFMVIV